MAMAELNDGASDGFDQPRRTGKSAAAFRTISEVAADLDVPPHVLRFWESKFPQIRPLKRGGGRRYYRPEDVDLLRRIRVLLYRDGYTIKGVQKLLRVPGARDVEPGMPGPPEPVPAQPAPVAVPVAVAVAPASAPVQPSLPNLPPPASIDRRELAEILDELIKVRALLRRI